MSESDSAAPDAVTGLDLRRVEEVSLNALQTQRQLFYDGWLLRVSPGKARRARSVNAHFGSTLPIGQKVAYCEKVYEARGLPVLFRMTPFVHPSNLGQELAARGYEAFDPTLVQTMALARPPEPRPCESVELASPGIDAFADAVALLQASTPEQRDAYYERMAHAPQVSRHLVAMSEGEVAGVGSAMLEDGLAGIFSMATAPAMRRRGVASAVLARLLAWAWERGATHAYLQVDEQNREAISVYRRFGFATAYTYWYCGREGERQ